MLIHKLDSRTADQIAAGEVVENPASLVKELVENSLDAGAKRIRIMLQKGGLQEITVIDDGTGIPSREVRRALARHATSKIACPEDLTRIHTLGFRGEALPSIASVSRLSLTSRYQNEESGVFVLFEGGKEIMCKEVGFAVGTKVTVQDLFYNTPARLKFLKGVPAETARITRTVQQLALSRPDVSLTLYRGKELLLETPGDGHLLNVIIKLYGSMLGRELVALNFNAPGMTLKGYLSNPAHTRRSRNLQSFFVNQRYVQSQLFRKALEYSFARIVTSRRYPAAFLFLHLPPENIDVNVHPGKTEIRFRQEEEVKTFLEQSIREAFSPGYFTAKSVTRPNRENKPWQQTSFIENNMNIREQGTRFSANPFLRDNIVLGNTGSLQHEQAAPEDKTRPLTPVEPGHKFVFEGLILGQVFGTYLLLVKDDRLIFIDQHAAHERIIWEKLQQQEKGKKQYLQTTLPFTLELPPLAAAEFQEKMELLRDIGLEMELFGHNTFIIRTVPFFIKDLFTAEMCRDIFEDLSPKALSDREFLKETQLQLACKAAVKAKQVLTFKEIESLLEQLAQCDNPFFCPHGRPVMFEMTKMEMEKKFKRRG